jgi:hypothetical protein
MNGKSMLIGRLIGRRTVQKRKGFLKYFPETKDDILSLRYCSLSIVDDVNQFGRGRLGDLLSKELRRKSAAPLHIFLYSLFFLFAVLQNFILPGISAMYLNSLSKKE